MACRVLVPWSVIEPKHTALQVGSLNPRTTREVPRSLTQRQEDGLSAGQVPPRSGVQWLYRLAYCSLSSIFLTGVRQGNNAVLRGLLWELSVWQSNHEFFFTEFEYTCIYFCKFSQAKGKWMKSLGISIQSKLCTKKLIKLLDQEPDRKKCFLV